ncbi:MAG: putative transport system permease protein [Chloroflexota bacterium]|nr:putative transport system permease protein [Chloroflexota bacterium]
MIGRLRLWSRYSLRAVRRGGQRSLLAIFCITVGVMAVVALRLAGDMVSLSLTSNLRTVIGADVTVQSNSIPLSPADLARFDELRRGGLIDAYTAIGVERGSARRGSGHIARVSVDVVDPAHYPLVGGGELAAPAQGTFATLLAAPGTVILSQFVADQAGVGPGDTIHLTLVRGGGADLRVAGLVRNSILESTAAYIAPPTYAAISGRPLGYGTVQATAPDPASAQRAAGRLRTAFPAASVQTVQDALDENITISREISRTLQIIGLLALLLGGIGIVNTMQVSLSRRRTEIAMLKTAGYRRRDLYALFGLEAAILGLAGGLAGTALGAGISAVVRVLVERVFLISIAFHVGAGTLVTGVMVGLATALIFGLLPIVRAAAIRPQAVLRDLPGGVTAGSAAQTAGLYALLVVLFAALSAGLLGSVLYALAAVAGTVAGLAVLAGVFWVIVWLVGHIPVPERLPLPRRMTTSLRLALRAIGRSRGRTATTLVALFTGVFGIGLVLVLGQNISTKVDESISRLSTYNLFAIAAPHDAAAVTGVTATLPGLQQRRVTADVAAGPTALNGTPLRDVVAGAGGSTGGSRRFRIGQLSGVEGYDLAGGQLPEVAIAAGRALTAADAGTMNVLGRFDVAFPPLLLGPGDTVTLQQEATGRSVTLRLVGLYTPISRGAGPRLPTFFEPVLGDRGVPTALGPDEVQTAVALRLDPAHTATAVRRIEDAAPGATVYDIADLGALVKQVLGNLTVLMLALASLALFAGVVIIANTVALAMLERRREIGILKAVGHSSRSVLSMVLIENAVVAAIGAVTGMVVVTIATALIGAGVLETDLTVGRGVAVSVVAGVVVVVVLVAGLVAWGPTRVRPLEVLRYE